ncbi:MAG: glycosyltransferase [Pirellulaceae bacterium]
MPPDNLVWLLLPVIVFDATRYCFAALAVWLTDVWHKPQHTSNTNHLARSYCPSVSLIVAGLNEGDSLQGTLERLWGTYPRLQIIIVDDGSTDNMADVARAFAKNHQGTIVISKKRGGKSSGMNAGLAYATGEITIILDADSELSNSAIWDIVQPLADPAVGAASGNVRVRNGDTNLVTRLQQYEYLRSVFLGRIVSSRLGILGIVSGAFGAFRTELLRQMGGWDVGPGEDEDIVLRIRKRGLRIEFVPLAECYTDAPTSWKVLTKQRRRWEWAVVTFESRKHIDMANPLNRHFRLDNFFLFAERWIFNLFLPLWFWVYLIWLTYTLGLGGCVFPSLLFYVLYVLGDVIQLLVILWYSPHRAKDWRCVAVLPIMPLYQFYQRLVTTLAIVEEMLSRRSFRDGFVPEHVRNATWHW